MEIPRDATIYIAGHRGLVGSALVRHFKAEGFSNLVFRTRAELDLRDQSAVRAFFDSERPEYVILAAARVGGIHANNTRPVDFILENLQIQTNVIESAFRSGTKKLLFLGSSCIYPKLAPQPIKEEYLFTGPLEPTNEWYAVAKIAGIKLCQAFRRQHGADFIAAMPTNLYGPGDNYDLEASHVLPALIRRFHEGRVSGACQVVCWGSGTPLREFLYVDDLARACVFLMTHHLAEEIINIGSGHEITINDLAALVKEETGFQGNIVWDSSKPDGTPRKLMDSSRLFALGWRPQVEIKTGIRLAYEDFLAATDRDWVDALSPPAPFQVAQIPGSATLR